MQDTMAARGISIPKIGAVEMADLVAYLYSVEQLALVGNAEIGAAPAGTRAALPATL